MLALVLVLALSLSIFSACNKKHKYSSEWKFDEKTHWHECTTKKHTDTSEKLPHEFKEVIVKAADYGVVGEKSTTGKIQLSNETERWISATIEKGYFKVGQTVELYNSTGTKVGEAKITEIKIKGTISASGCAIPSDGLVTITLDTGFSNMTYGKLVAK